MKKILGITLIGALLAGCGGGGGGTSSVTPPVSGGGKTSQVKIKVAINPASSQASLRGRKYVSRNTQGIGVSYQATGTVTGNFGTTELGLASPMVAFQATPGWSAPNITCTTQATPSSTYDCTFVITAPAGYDDFQITLWDSVPGNGPGYFVGANDLSTATISNQLVNANENNVFNYAFNGVVNGVSLQLSSPTLAAGAPLGTSPNPATETLNVIARDYDGNVIIGSDPYVDVNGNPVTITVNPPTVTYPAWINAGVTEWVQVTYVNSSGESTPSAESGYTLPSQGRLTVTSPATAGSGATYATGYNVYASTTSGSEVLLNSTPIPIGQDYDITDSSAGGVQVPPGVDSSGLGSPAAAQLTFGAPLTTGNITVTTTTFTKPGSTTVTYDGGDIVNASFSATVTSTSVPTVTIPATPALLMFTRVLNSGLGVPAPLAVNEFSVTNVAPQHGTVGLDGNVWFGSSSGLLQIAPGATSGTQYPLNTGGIAFDVTNGADGNLWVTQLNGIIADFNPYTTAETDYTLPANHQPWSIIRGADNNVWFTENDFSTLGDWVGVMSPTGVLLHEYPIGTDSGLDGIAYGPDGNYWVCDQNTGSVTKISPAGVVLNTYISGFNAPQRIVAGPDGNLWVTDFSAGSVDKVTTAGVVTKYTFPPGYSPMDIVVGADQNLWLTVRDTSGGGDVLLRVQTNGTMNPLFNGVTSADGVFGIASGSDGNIYFSDSSANDAGEVHLH